MSCKLSKQSRHWSDASFCSIWSGSALFANVPIVLVQVLQITYQDHSFGKFSRQQIDIFLIFFHKTGFDISCKLSPLETICMKCQILFCGKKKRKYFNMPSAETFVQRWLIHLLSRDGSFTMLVFEVVSDIVYYHWWTEKKQVLAKPLFFWVSFAVINSYDQSFNWF